MRSQIQGAPSLTSVMLAARSAPKRCRCRATNSAIASGPGNVPVHDGPRLLLHPPVFIVDKNRDQLRFAPLGIKGLPRTLLRSPRNILHRQTLFVGRLRLVRHRSQIAADFGASAVNLHAHPFALQLLPRGKLALPPRITSSVRKVNMPRLHWYVIRVIVLTSISSPSRASSSCANCNDGHKAACRLTRLSNAGEQPLPKPNCASSMCKPTEQLVTLLPLTALWTDAGFIEARRVRYLVAGELRELLRAGPVRFVVADCGERLRWIDEHNCFEFWKNDLKAHIATPEKFDLAAFPGEYCYVASEWLTEQQDHVIVLEKHH